MRKIVVTGMGVVSPLGKGLAQAWEKVRDARNAHGVVRNLVVCDEEKFSWAKELPCQIAAVCQSNDPSLEEKVQGFGSLSAPRFIQFAVKAASDALEDANWLPRGVPMMEEKTGVSIGNSIGSIQDVFEAGMNNISEKGSDDQGDRIDGINIKNLRKKLSPFFVPRILVNMASGAVSIKHKLRGPSASSSTACAAGAHAIGEAARVLHCGEAEVMVAGGTESCVNLVAMTGFCKAKALSTAFNDLPSEASRPFDKTRDGFVMSEGAAVLVLETEEHAVARGARIYCELAGIGSSNDGHHITNPDPSGRGAVLSMQRALVSAKMKPEEIGYVNAHATSTPMGDEAEIMAVSQLFESSHAAFGGIPISSTKGATGHLLSAAGSIEAVFVAMAVNQGWIPPTANLTEPLSHGRGIRFVNEGGEPWIQRQKRAALSNSFGFGGTNSSLIFKEYP